MAKFVEIKQTPSGSGTTKVAEKPKTTSPTIKPRAFQPVEPQSITFTRGTTEAEIAEAANVARAEAFQEGTRDLVTVGEGYLSKAQWNELSPEDQTYIAQHGIENYNTMVKVHNAEVERFKSNNVEINPGEWVSKTEWTKLTPEQRKEVKETGSYTVQSTKETVGEKVYQVKTNKGEIEVPAAEWESKNYFEQLRTILGRVPTSGETEQYARVVAGGESPKVLPSWAYKDAPGTSWLHKVPGWTSVENFLTGGVEKFTLGAELIIPGRQSAAENYYWSALPAAREATWQYKQAVYPKYPLIEQQSRLVLETIGLPGIRATSPIIGTKGVRNVEWAETGITALTLTLPLWAPPVVRGVKAIRALPESFRAKLGTFPFSESPGLTRVVTIERPVIQNWPVSGNWGWGGFNFRPTYLSSIKSGTGRGFTEITGIGSGRSYTNIPVIEDVPINPVYGFRTAGLGSYAETMAAPSYVSIPSRSISGQISTRIMPTGQPLYVVDIPFTYPLGSPKVSTSISTKEVQRTKGTVLTMPQVRPEIVTGGQSLVQTRLSTIAEVVPSSELQSSTLTRMQDLSLVSTTNQPKVDTIMGLADMAANLTRLQELTKPQEMTQTQTQTSTKTLTDVLAKTTTGSRGPTSDELSRSRKRLIIPILIGDEEETERIFANPPLGSIIWHSGLYWNVVPPPYTKRYTRRAPPKGARYTEVSGKGMAKKTLQIVGGSAVSDADVRLGFMDVRIRKGATQIDFIPGEGRYRGKKLAPQTFTFGELSKKRVVTRRKPKPKFKEWRWPTGG